MDERSYVLDIKVILGDVISLPRYYDEETDSWLLETNNEYYPTEEDLKKQVMETIRKAFEGDKDVEIKYNIRVNDVSNSTEVYDSQEEEGYVNQVWWS